MLLNQFEQSRKFEEPSGGADGGGVVAAPPPATSGDSAPSASPETSSDFGPGGGRSVTEGSDAFSDVVAHATRNEAPPPRIDPARAAAVQQQLNGPQAPPPTAPSPVAAQPPVVGQPTAVQQPPVPAQQAPQGPPSAAQMAGEAAVYQQKRNATIAELEQAYGQFTEEEKLQLMTEPHLVLPRLLARAQTDALEYTIRSVAQMIPQLTQATIQQNIQEHQALETFYGHFPELRSHPQGSQTIWEIGNAYIRANPYADAQTRMRDIGLLAKARLGLLAPAAPAAVGAAPQPQSMPLLPPYTPAGVGGSAVPSGPVSHLPYLDDILPLRRL